MTYPELKIALDMGDPETVLSSISDLYNNSVDLKYHGCYFIVCDDGDVHCFDKDGIEQKIMYIPGDCFAYDHSLEKIIIPETVTSIGSCAFYDCIRLTSAIISNSVRNIRPCAFGECRGLTSVTIGNSVMSIENGAFSGCRNLTSMTIGNRVTSIGNSAFAYCSSLTNMTIPDSVTSIGTCVFSRCSSLTDVTMSSSIDHINRYVFYGCYKLKKVLFKGKTIEQVRAMENYPWEIEDESIIQTEL